MKSSRARFLWAVAVICTLAATLPAAASTFQRVGLDRLVADSSTVVVGQVVDAHSYWNEGGTFILTDVIVSPSEYLKGDGETGDLTVTLMGGTVGELTTLIVGGPELHVGNAYVLFLGDADLPGASGARSVRGMAQGTFDLVEDAGESRAVSQASRQALLPGPAGEVSPPGGPHGLALSTLRSSVRELVRGEGPGVRR